MGDITAKQLENGIGVWSDWLPEACVCNYSNTAACASTALE